MKIILAQCRKQKVGIGATGVAKTFPYEQTTYLEYKIRRKKISRKSSRI